MPNVSSLSDGTSCGEAAGSCTIGTASTGTVGTVTVDYSPQGCWTSEDDQSIYFRTVSLQHLLCSNGLDWFICHLGRAPANLQRNLDFYPD